jgi:hypothetical protein
LKIVKKQIFFLFIFLCFGFLVILSACKDEPNQIGLNIQPPNDKLNANATDTTTIVAYSALVDSVKTDKTTTNLLGSLADPAFGTITASIYTQLRLSKTAFSFGTNPVLDSLVLTLQYAGFYGDSTSAQTVKVFELSDSLRTDTVYYSNMEVPTYGIMLANLTFVPDFRDSVIVGKDTLPPVLKINLSSLTPELGQKLLAATTDEMVTHDAFLRYFYGLVIKADPAYQGGMIMYFNLVSTLTKMSLYYRNDESDSLRFDYVINSFCPRFGNFKHDFSHADWLFKKQVIDKDTLLGKNICYVESMAGVKTMIRFPYLKNYYKDGAVAINEAKLILKGFESDPPLAKAATLALVKSDGAGGYTILNDQLEGTTYFGSNYVASQNEYWFRITRYVQDVLKSTNTDFGLELYVSGGAINAERTLLSGTSPSPPGLPDDRIKLIITYTHLH